MAFKVGDKAGKLSCKTGRYKKSLREGKLTYGGCKWVESGSSLKVGGLPCFVILNLFQDLLLKHFLYSPRDAEMS